MPSAVPNGTLNRWITDRKLAGQLLRWAAEAGVEIDCQLKSAIEEGFPEGEDAFDALVGLLGMLEVVQTAHSSASSGASGPRH